MITGRVTSEREPVVQTKVRAPGGRAESIWGVIDTGFSESLTLPRERIASPGLPFRGSQRATLADGSEVILAVYRALVEWHGRALPVLVLGTEGGALLGMALPQDSRLTTNVVADGAVRIEPIAEA